MVWDDRKDISGRKRFGTTQKQDRETKEWFVQHIKAKNKDDDFGRKYYESVIHAGMALSKAAKAEKLSGDVNSLRLAYLEWIAEDPRFNLRTPLLLISELSATVFLLSLKLRIPLPNMQSIKPPKKVRAKPRNRSSPMSGEAVSAKLRKMMCRSGLL